MKRKWLIIGIILLLIGTSIFPALAQTTEKSQPTSRGNWLYVGGNGPGNYTKIQDAVNASIDGDTVYVYDDSAPYYEVITINTSITLRGENQQTTFLLCTGSLESMITINAPYVTICNFTLKNPEREGVMIYQSYATISHITIQDSGDYGWIGAITANPPKQRGFIDKILIQNNTIERSWTGIELYFCNRAMVTGNVLVDNVYGIQVLSSFHNEVSANIISECEEIGILDYISGKNTYQRNTLINNTYGLECVCSTRDIIEKNNFLNNTQQAYFVKVPVLSLAVIRNMVSILNFYFLLNYRIIRPTIWRQNYWNESRMLPYVIVGEFVKDPYDPTSVTKRYNVDMNPAQEPYDI